MSSERYQSPVWDDVIRVWTDPQGAAAGGLRDGRGWADWWRVVVLYGLVTAFSIVFRSRIRADRIWDPIFGEPSSREFMAEPFELIIIISILTCFVGMMFFQWLLLPKVSGWFSGSRSRMDASLTYYFFFAVSFMMTFAVVLEDLGAVLVEQWAPHRGGYFSWIASTVILGAAFHQMSRISVRTLNLPSYLRSMGVMLISLLLGLVLSLLLIAAILVPLALLFPDLVGPPQ